MQTSVLAIRCWLTAVLGLALSLPASAQSPAAQWNGLPLGQVTLGGQSLRIISASTERERILSLSKYQALLPGEGVLHIYPTSGKRCLLTREIPVELDAAYLDAHHRVLEIGTLIAAHSQAQCAENPAQQVLTVNRGRLAALGIEVGTTLPTVQPLSAQVLAQETAAIGAQHEAMRAQQAAQEAQDRQAPPRAALRVGGQQMEPLLVFVHRDGGMDNEREAAKLPLQEGWLYVFEHEVLPGTCRSADQIHNPLWEPFKYRQYAFDRAGRLLGDALRDDGKLCAGNKGGMRYALVMPHRAPVLPSNDRLQLAPAMQAIARQRFSSDIGSVHRSGHYRYTCNDDAEQVETLLTIEGSDADGRIRAWVDMYLFHHGRHQAEHIKAELQGYQDEAGQYVFTPDNTLKAATRYQLQGITDAGARPLDHLNVAMRGLQCNADAADFAYASSDETTHSTAVAAAFDAVSEGTAGDGQFFADNYSVQIVRYELGSSRVGGANDGAPGFLERLAGVFFGHGDRNYWAYQCSNRTYHITIRAKHDIPYAGTERYPFKMPVAWRLVQALSGGNSNAQTSSEYYLLPARMGESVSDTVTFGCVDEYHTMRGSEQSAQLRMDVGATSRVMHRAEWTGAINHAAVNAEESRQLALLSKALDQNNAEWAEIGRQTDRQMEQDRINQEQAKVVAEATKKAQREAQKEADRKAEERRRKELACAREKAANGGKPKLFSDCDGL